MFCSSRDNYGSSQGNHSGDKNPSTSLFPLTWTGGSAHKKGQRQNEQARKTIRHKWAWRETQKGDTVTRASLKKRGGGGRTVSHKGYSKGRSAFLGEKGSCSNVGGPATRCLMRMHPGGGSSLTCRWSGHGELMEGTQAQFFFKNGANWVETGTEEGRLECERGKETILGLA